MSYEKDGTKEEEKLNILSNEADIWRFESGNEWVADEIYRAIDIRIILSCLKCE